MMKQKDDKEIMREFGLRQSRQFLAIAVTILLILFIVLLSKRYDLFGEFPKDAILGAEILVIASFIGFSAFNWRCPSCNKYLGSDIHRHICKKCRTRLR
jgi:hypothetical protein